MKKLYLLIPLIAILFVSCSKRDYYVNDQLDINQWMRSHDHGTVAYVDYSSGNYIVESYSGYSVVQPWTSNTPLENDNEYAYFNIPGVQNIYNLSGDYFAKATIVEVSLSWEDALYVLDDLNYHNY
jgi:hypothetical protein